MSSGLSIFGHRVKSLTRAGEKTFYPLPDNKLSALSKLKAFDDNFSVSQTVQFFSEKIVEKGEKVASIFFFFFFNLFILFLFFLLILYIAVFSKALSSRVVKNQEIFDLGKVKKVNYISFSKSKEYNSRQSDLKTVLCLTNFALFCS